MLYFPFCVSASAMPSAAFSFCVRRRALPFGSARIKFQAPHRQPFQIDDRFSDFLKHALDLVEAALTDGNADPAFKNARLFFCRFQNGKLGRKCRFVVPNVEPFGKCLPIFFCHFSVNHGLIHFRDMRFRREQPVGKGSVVRNQQQPSVSLSSRPTGKRSFLAASLKRSSTVRSRRSSVAETTPAGLWSIQYSIFT